MRIAVCIKQVPDTSEIKIDPVKHTLIRDGVPAIVNPYDKNAVEAAVQLKEKHGGEVVVITMGLPSAKKALKECISLGCDKAYLVTDRAFGGADTYATSYKLASTIEKLGPFDLILCGKQAIDGDTGQTGSSMSAHLGIPQLTYALGIEVNGEKVKVQREVEEGTMVLEASMPALITVGKDINVPRYPSIRSKIDSYQAEIEEIHLDNLPNIDTSKIGLKGSPTRVKKSFTPDKTKNGVKISGGGSTTVVNGLLQYLGEKGLV